MSFEKLKVPIDAKLSLHVRLYSGGSKTPAVCIPGLTRNAKDFEDLAPRIAAGGRDVAAIDLRGRGASDHDPDYRNYHPLTYRDDVLAALDRLDWAEAVFIGTSLGGIVTMLVHESAPDRVCAAVLNDIGPDLAPEGVARITDYVGKNAAAGPAASVEEAAARVRAINESAFPDAAPEDWLAFARRTFRQRDDGKWVLDHDPNIARALAENAPAPDLWPGFASLNAKPTLVVRGALSDLLSPAIVGKMRTVHPGFDYCEVPRIGHAPMLTEPAAWAALEVFLAEID